ncbi:MAG: hypothetical protein ACYDHE_21130 [Candidatus Acidiferrales bacterium]
MRDDVHSPSHIVPSDYEYVAVWTMNIQGFGDCQFILREREIVKNHMVRTGGTYAHVDTTGSCQVCGNVMAIYLALFWHKPSNTYLRVGFDCSQKLDMSGDGQAYNLFRRQLQDVREAQAGKKKAIAILADAGLSAAWDIYTQAAPGHLDGCVAKGTDQFGDDNGAHHLCTCGYDIKFFKEWNAWEETTIRDIVGKLVKYGSISEKQTNFIKSLLTKIERRPIIEAARKAEHEAAGPVPTGRVRLTGTVLSVKTVERATRFYGDDGLSTKVLIRLENGSKVYGNRFANVEKDQVVTFKASVEASKDDAKFGFFKRAKKELS